MNANIHREEESLEQIALAIAEDERHRQVAESERLKKAHDQRVRIERVGALLRFIGVSVLLVSAATLLMQRWDGLAHVTRYLSFLAFTATVCIAGIFCGVKIGENKGARALLGVVILLVPVHFAQLGALLYSRFGQSLDSNSYPRYLFWDAPSLEVALVTTAVGLIALTPMMFVAFGVLARRHSKALVGLSFLTGVGLIYPSRDPYVIGALVLALGLLCVQLDKIFFVESDARTREATLARATPYVTLGIVVARQCLLYKTPMFAHGLVYTGASYALFTLAPRVVTSRVAIWFAEAAALVCAILAAVMFGGTLSSAVRLSDYATVMVTGLSLSVVLSGVATKAREAKGLYRAISFFCCVTIGAIHVFQVSNMERVVNGLVCGIIIVAWSCLIERRSLLIAGLLLVGCGCVDAVGVAVRSIDVSPWFFLGMVGLLTVLAASYVERHYLRLMTTVRTLRTRVKAW